MSPLDLTDSAALWTRLGAVPEGDDCRFTVWAPLAQRVAVVLEPHAAAGASAGGSGAGAAAGGERARHTLDAAGGGLFTGVVPGAGAGTRYRVWVDGRGPFPDPASRFQPDGVHGASQVVDPNGFAWSDAGWPGRTLEELVIYELHVGTFTPEGTFAAAIAKLPHLVALGVTAIELMPLADFPGDRNWGYDGAALWAPARCYGAPDDFRRLVDAAHASGLAVHLDVVYNHLGPDGAYLVAVAPPVLVRDRPSGWGAGLNLDGAHSPGVREFLIANAIHWVHEYHLDGLRLDATPMLLDNGPRHFVAELTERVKAAAPGRPIVVIAEDVRNQAATVTPSAAGGWGCDGMWSFDFHNQIHRYLTGQSDGYFADFADSIGDLATIVSRGWLFAGEHSTYWNGPRGGDPAGVAPPRLVFYLQNHDEVGNRGHGVRLHHLVDPATYRAAVTLLLIAPQTPLLFMGQEWATTAPFMFFTDHHEELGRRVAAGRRLTFSKFAEFADLDAELPHPQHDPTFEASRLRWDERTLAPHAAVLALHRTLIVLRRHAPALRRRAPARAVALDAATLLVRRDALDGSAIVAVVRLRGAGRVAFDAHQLTHDLAGRAWRVALHTEQAEYAPDPAPVEIDAGHAITFAQPGAVVFAVDR